MSEASGQDASRSRRTRGEGELTAQLITAASRASGPLTQEEIDQILGVRPDDESG